MKTILSRDIHGQWTRKLLTPSGEWIDATAMCEEPTPSDRRSPDVRIFDCLDVPPTKNLDSLVAQTMRYVADLLDA